jgi:hypothetical protein
VWCGGVRPDSRSAQDAAQAQRLSNVNDGSTLSNVTDDEDYDPRSNDPRSNPSLLPHSPRCYKTKINICCGNSEGRTC